MRRQQRRNAPAATREETGALRRHLVASGLAGRVATSPRSTVQNCAKLAAGDDDYHFGLSDWRTATADDALDAVRALCGEVRTGPDELDGPGWIDPD
ncbi:MAG: phosphatase, partial [Actinomycetota bacterium]|nr:phosphatase [Actinomycetota bacterium]